MLTLRRGRYHARLACGSPDLDRALALRARGFGRAAGVSDRDCFDAICHHILIEQVATGDLVGCFRLLPIPSGAAVGDSYAAQHYDLRALGLRSGPMLELGRFCIAPGHRDPDILRLAWGAITALVDADGFEFLFGCSSFAGQEPSRYADALGLLHGRHLAPARLAPRVRAPDVVTLRPRPGAPPPDPRRDARFLAVPGDGVSAHRSTAMGGTAPLRPARLPPAASCEPGASKLTNNGPSSRARFARSAAAFANACAASRLSRASASSVCSAAACSSETWSFARASASSPAELSSCPFTAASSPSAANRCDAVSASVACVWSSCAPDASSFERRSSISSSARRARPSNVASCASTSARVVLNSSTDASSCARAAVSAASAL